MRLVYQQMVKTVSMVLMEQLVQTLGDQTRLTVAVDLTAPDERIETHTAGEWRRRQLPEMNRRPAIFIIG